MLYRDEWECDLFGDRSHPKLYSSHYSIEDKAPQGLKKHLQTLIILE